MINFCKYYNLPIRGHKHFDFVDIPIDTDVKLFLDPGLIAAGTDSISIHCADVIESFFEEVFNCCRAQDSYALKNLLKFSAEPNETHLGLSTMHSQGRGASEEILLDLFSGIIKQGLFERDIITQPSDICILAPNFDEDRMSDLLTNILRDIIAQFTIQQGVKHSVPLGGEHTGHYWDAADIQWKSGRWRSPIADNHPVLLVPKSFVSRSYHFGTDSYIRRYLLKYRQKHHLDNNTEMCHTRELKDGRKKIYPPTKIELRQKELAGTPLKKHAADFAREHPDTLRAFGMERNDMLASGKYTMTDTELDQMLYYSNYATA